MSVWILLFLCMMTMPLVVAMLHCNLKKGKILEIRQDYVRNARYFGKRFAELIEKALPDMKDGVITLSRKEEAGRSDFSGEGCGKADYCHGNGVLPEGKRTFLSQGNLQ